MNSSSSPATDVLHVSTSELDTNWTDSDVLHCDSWKPPNHILFHLANIAVLLGLFAPKQVHGVLFLHGTFLLGFLLLSVWAWVILCAPDFFSWNFSFMVINVVQTVFLMYHIRPIKFSPDLEQLYVTLFQPMDVSRHLFKRLISPDICTLSGLHEGEAYAMQTISKTDRLSLLLSGTMKVYSHQNLLHKIHEMEFIDSPEFESSVTGEEKFQVSIVAETLCRYVYWPRQSLEYLLLKEPYLTTVINTMIGRDITNKLYALNDRVYASRLDIRLPSIAASVKQSGDARRILATKMTPLVSVGDDSVDEDDTGYFAEPHKLSCAERVELLNGHTVHASVDSTHFPSGRSTPVQSDTGSNMSGIHFNI